MGQERHVADGESSFIVMNITPDFCKVGATIVPFDICQTLESQKSGYSTSVFSRDAPVLLVDSVIAQVKGNAGKGLLSQVSQASGHSKILAGSTTVLIEDRMVARHDDLVDMNGKVAG